jgi:hypothetical protein
MRSIADRRRKYSLAARLHRIVKFDELDEH